MDRTVYTFIWTFVLLSLIQDSLCAYQRGRVQSWRPMQLMQSMQLMQPMPQQQPSAGYFRPFQFADADGSNDLIDALEDLYKDNNDQITGIGLSIKQSMMETIQNWEVDPETVKYVIRKIDETLRPSQSKLGEVWRKFRSMVTSGMASQLMRNVDMKRLFKNLISEIDIEKLISYIPAYY